MIKCVLIWYHLIGYRIRSVDMACVWLLQDPRFLNSLLLLTVALVRKRFIYTVFSKWNIYKNRQSRDTNKLGRTGRRQTQVRKLKRWVTRTP
jgi:hypothetical protein